MIPHQMDAVAPPSSRRMGKRSEKSTQLPSFRRELSLGTETMLFAPVQTILCGHADLLVVILHLVTQLLEELEGRSKAAL